MRAHLLFLVALPACAGQVVTVTNTYQFGGTYGDDFHDLWTFTTDPLSSLTTSTNQQTGSLIEPLVNTSFEVPAVPSGATFVAWYASIQGSLIGATMKQLSVTPVVADCSGVPCAYEATPASFFASPTSVWADSSAFYLEISSSPFFVTMDPSLTGATINGTVGAAAGYDFMAQMGKGFNSVTVYDIAGPWTWSATVKISTDFEVTVPEPGMLLLVTTGLATLTLRKICGSSRLNR